ncbi:hypothetical protein DESC_290177 [Desulfosarcina cetonica]|nr:hypothetical protein DESC_290177 [Desulfosarcina cetonica]
MTDLKPCRHCNRDEPVYKSGRCRECWLEYKRAWYRRQHPGARRYKQPKPETPSFTLVPAPTGLRALVAWYENKLFQGRPDGYRRNYFCRHYEACLDAAAGPNLGFDCRGCTHEFDIGGLIDSQNSQNSHLGVF